MPKSSGGIHVVNQFQRGVSADCDTYDLEIKMRQKSWDKIYGWCRACDVECSGLGLVEKVGTEYRVQEVYLLDQVCTGAHTDITQEGIAKMQQKLHSRKVPLSKVRFWWHTHCDFATFWSGTDRDTAATLAGNAANWVISMVVNQKGDYRLRFDMLDPVKLTLDELKMNVPFPKRMGSIRKSKWLVDKKVKRRTFSPHPDHFSTPGNYGGYSGIYVPPTIHSSRRSGGFSWNDDTCGGSEDIVEPKWYKDLRSRYPGLERGVIVSPSSSKPGVRHSGYDIGVHNRAGSTQKSNSESDSEMTKRLKECGESEEKTFKNGGHPCMGCQEKCEECPHMNDTEFWTKHGFDDGNVTEQESDPRDEDIIISGRDKGDEYWDADAKVWRVWQGYMQCYIARGEESESHYRLNGQLYSRKELRDYMMAQQDARRSAMKKAEKKARKATKKAKRRAKAQAKK